MAERISQGVAAAAAVGAVPVDAGKVQSGSDQVSGNGQGVPYEDWGSTQYATETGIPSEMEVKHLEVVDQALVDSLVGVDVQVHGLDNRPQAVVPDAGLKDEQNVVIEDDGRVSQETAPGNDFVEAGPDDEVTGFVGDDEGQEVSDETQGVQEGVETPDVAPETEPKRKPGRPRKDS